MEKPDEKRNTFFGIILIIILFIFDVGCGNVITAKNDQQVTFNFFETALNLQQEQSQTTSQTATESLSELPDVAFYRGLFTLDDSKLKNFYNAFRSHIPSEIDNEAEDYIDIITDGLETYTDSYVDEFDTLDENEFNINDLESNVAFDSLSEESFFSDYFDMLDETGHTSNEPLNIQSQRTEIPFTSAEDEVKNTAYVNSENVDADTGFPKNYRKKKIIEEMKKRSQIKQKKLNEIRKHPTVVRVGQIDNDLYDDWVIYEPMTQIEPNEENNIQDTQERNSKFSSIQDATTRLNTSNEKNFSSIQDATTRFNTSNENKEAQLSTTSRLKTSLFLTSRLKNATTQFNTTNENKDKQNKDKQLYSVEDATSRLQYSRLQPFQLQPSRFQKEKENMNTTSNDNTNINAENIDENRENDNFSLSIEINNQSYVNESDLYEYDQELNPTSLKEELTIQDLHSNMSNSEIMNALRHQKSEKNKDGSPVKNNYEVIDVWDPMEMRYITYQLIARFWSTQNVNSYIVRHHNPRKILGQRILPRLEHRPPTVLPTLNIYYTIDDDSLGNLQANILALKEPNGTMEYDDSNKLELIDVFNSLNKLDRIAIIKETIEDAFQTWNVMLNGIVNFEYVPYSEKLRRSNYIDRIIVVSVKNLIHINEHTSQTEIFSNTRTLAHASVNFLHINGQTNKFLIAPHHQRKRLQILIPNDNKLNVYSIEGLSLIERFQQQSYRHMHEELYNSLKFLRKTKFSKSNCFFCTLLHEIGHILGLGHTNSLDSIMHPIIEDDNSGITEVDVRAIKTIFKQLISREKRMNIAIRKNMCKRFKCKS